METKWEGDREKERRERGREEERERETPKYIWSNELGCVCVCV